MLITTKGIIIKEKSIGESDKYLDVLTENLGVIEVKARGSKKITSKSFASCQLFAFSEFCLNFNNGKYYINSSKPINIFYGIREDVEKLALAVYFTDILKHAATDEEESAKILHIFLLSLYYLSYGKQPSILIKSVFELRIMSEIGYKPDLHQCSICGSEEAVDFSIEDACLFCDKCKPQSNVKLLSAALKAMRYIVDTVETKKIFSFNLTGDSLNQLTLLSQKYVFYHLDMSFRSLDYYYRIKSKG